MRRIAFQLVVGNVLTFWVNDETAGNSTLSIFSANVNLAKIDN